MIVKQIFPLQYEVIVVLWRRKKLMCEMHKQGGERKIMKKKLALFMVAVLMLVACPISQAKAANTGITTIQFGKVYKNFDLDGDGKKDSFKVTTSYPKGDQYGSGILSIYVNNKKVFSQKRRYDPYWNVNLVTVGTGETFIDYEGCIGSDDGCIHRLYRAQKNKLKMLYDFQKYYDECASYYNVTIKKVEGNTIYTSAGAQFNATGGIDWKMNYVYQDGRIGRTSSQFTPIYYDVDGNELKSKKWTANRNLNVYDTLGGSKRKYTVKKNEVVQIVKIVFKDFKVYFQVKDKNGNLRYLFNPNTTPNPEYFKEAQRAG